MLAQLRDTAPKFEALGTQIVAVSVKAPYQAQHLLDNGMPFPLLIDPEDSVRKAIGIERMAATRLLTVSGARAYAKALGRWRDWTLKPSEATQRPGAILLDADQQVVWKHVGNRLGDYPTIDQLLEQAQALSA